MFQQNTVQQPRVCRAWAVVYRRNGHGVPAYLLLLENTGSGDRSAWLNLGNPAIEKLGQIVDLSKLQWDQRHEFKPNEGFKPEVEIIFNGAAVRAIKDIRRPVNDVIVADLWAYAESLGLMPHSKNKIDFIIRDCVTRVDKADPERAKELIAAIGKPRCVVKINE